MEILTMINDTVYDIVWGIPAMIAIGGVGLLMLFTTRAIQFRKFGLAISSSVKSMLKNNKAEAGAVTPLQAVATALASTVGTGNIVGVAGAVAVGGPGAVFWMWISALLGMGTKFAEVTLALKYRTKNEKGEWVGGPMYFITNGLNRRWHFLAYFFAIFGIGASFGIGNIAQSNSICSSVKFFLTSFNIPHNGEVLNLILGVVLAVLSMLILIGGMKRIGNVTELLVPFMAFIYIIAGLGLIIIKFNQIPTVLTAIFSEAFTPRAIIGGGIFTVIKKGVGRGVFSNEAGMGTACIAQASSTETEPVKQGFFGIFEVFVSIIICSLTAFVILCGVGVENINYGIEPGIELTIQGFSSVYGNAASFVTMIVMICFAFSTIIGWSLYGIRCIEFLFGKAAIMPYLLIRSLACIAGCTGGLTFVWNLSDTLNGLMAIPNLIGVALLSPVLAKTVKEYFAKN